MEEKTNKIIGWTIEVEWSDGKVEKLGDCDDTTAGYVDDYLNEVEREKNGRKNK